MRNTVMGNDSPVIEQDAPRMIDSRAPAIGRFRPDAGAIAKDVAVTIKPRSVRRVGRNGSGTNGFCIGSLHRGIGCKRR